MKIRTLCSFVGKVCMTKGEVRTVGDELAADLIRAGYAAPAEERPGKRTARREGQHETE